MTYTTLQAAQALEIPYQTFTWHIRRLGIPKQGRHYELTEHHIEQLRESIRRAKPGRPFGTGKADT